MNSCMVYVGPAKISYVFIYTETAVIDVPVRYTTHSFSLANCVPITVGVVIAVIVVVLVAAIAVVAIILIRYRLGFKMDVSLHKNYYMLHFSTMCTSHSMFGCVSKYTRTYVCFLNISFLVYFLKKVYF